MDSFISTVRGSLVLLAIFLVPGWFVLSLRREWREWPGLQSWIIAVGLGIAFYPILFYWAKLFPFWTMGPRKMAVLLAALALVAAWRLRGAWKRILTFDWLEWTAIAIVGMTVFTRFWIIGGRPYPAWSDSLHHVLLTRLTAAQGALPATMAPYFPVSLNDYHLGLYAITATVEWLANVPSHTALLWTGQLLNGLCGIGVYLVMDRKAGRVGAIAAAAVAGLLSHQPAFYVNWGRFTQLSGQTILAIAWLVTWEVLGTWRQSQRCDRSNLAWRSLLAASLCAALFLLHYRVALFFAPLFMLTAGWELCGAVRNRETARWLVFGMVATTVLAIGIAAPGLVPALTAIVGKLLSHPLRLPTGASNDQLGYFRFPWETVPVLAGRVWLLALAGLGGLVGLVRRNHLVVLCVMWVFILLLIGNAYLLGISWLNLTNLGAVLIMLYLPIAVLAGDLAEEFSRVLAAQQEGVTRVVVAGILAACFIASHVRVTEIEPFRYFVTPEDVAAMDWVRNNTDPDATFAVNTYFWLPGNPHGTDAGYWIPYFADRQMSAGVMLMSLATPEYRARVLSMSEAEERLAAGLPAVADLRSLGVDYIYLGAVGDFSGPALSAAKLSQLPELTLAYESAHVAVFEIEGTE